LRDPRFLVEIYEEISQEFRLSRSLTKNNQSNTNMKRQQSSSTRQEKQKDFFFRRGAGFQVRFVILGRHYILGIILANRKKAFLPEQEQDAFLKEENYEQAYQ
jgi:3'-phosphoadenosine 5'-phosphosulfate sulfotransferase